MRYNTFRIKNLRKKIILKVPYYHQLDPATGLPPQFRKNGCAIVCVKMVLEYSFGRQFEINNLYEEAKKAGGRNDNGDWTHAAQVRVLKQHQLLAWRRNWNLSAADRKYFTAVENYDEAQLEAVEKQNQNAAILAILNSIQAGNPVIVSVKKHFRYKNKRHQVLVIGFDEENLYINDPIAQDPNDHPMKINRQYLIDNFNYQAIFTSKP